jgi:hypothetical protein
MQLIDDSGSRQIICKELTLDHMKVAGSKLAGRIIRLLSDEPQGMHASRIAKELREHEQKIYYHTRRLIKAGILEIHHTEDSKGGTAKVLALQEPAFAVRFGKFEPYARASSIPSGQAAFLRPFIEGGKLNARIIVGSPDPHGPEQARSRDANYAIDLGLFLGTFLSTRSPPAVQLDTELRAWDQNLIIVGGPVVNRAAERINRKSPARYDFEEKAFMVKGKQYSHESIGVIAKMPNPFSKGKWILHIAGKRHTGTRAAVIALLTDFEKVCAASITIVEGVDADSDGIIDRSRIIAQA